MNMIGILILLVLFNFCAAKTSEQLDVNIESGRILGRYMTSESGKTIRAFMGIPYAEPPVGNFRFRSPVRKQIWLDVLKTQIEPPKCISSDYFFEESEDLIGQEDCLYLNVYAPVFDMKSGKKFPVMVFFHGGAWFTGSGGYSQFPPEHLLEHDVILVSGNYRLGVLGFLSFEDATCSGNFGLKDQSMILRWVKNNVDKFGGDSNKITIVGQSAGGASVNYHSISPMSKGLFNYGILQSGSLFNVWSDPVRPGLAKERAIRLTEMMECTANDTREMTDCLRKIDIAKLTKALEIFYVSSLNSFRTIKLYHFLLCFERNGQQIY
jgi:carboxylesterase type B